MTEELKRALKDLAEIGEQINTQDNRMTANPAFKVNGYRRVPVDPEYDYDAYGFYGEDVSEIYYEDTTDPVKWKEMADLALIDELPEGTEKFFYKEHLETVETFLTLKGAEQYLRNNGHNLGHLHGVHIYVDTFYRNYEMIAVREALSLIAKNKEVFE